MSKDKHRNQDQQNRPAQQATPNNPNGKPQQAQSQGQQAWPQKNPSANPQQGRPQQGRQDDTRRK
ncbi:MAG: hypothetical protein NTU49_04150 [Gammaproteobacteria bacterium]|nr:hypothetical protein [Gammaproteobacteria bacterium]